jgi:protein TonB
MERKKSPKADLQARRSLLLEIGLCVALGLMLVMFGWSQKERKLARLTDASAIVESEMVEVTRQDVKTPEPLQKMPVIAEVINIVSNDVNTPIDAFDFPEPDDIFIPRIETKEEVKPESEPFMKAEQMPKFQKGDLNKFRSWVQSRLVYPALAQENGVQGMVTIQFVVESDGTLGRFKVLQAPDKLLSDEIIRILNDSPKWTPGKQRGKAVPVYMQLPISFVLQ